MKRDKNFYITKTWNVEDVTIRANELGIKVTTKEAIEVLEDIENNWDSEIGISWTNIDVGLEELEDTRETDKAEDDTPNEVIQGKYIMTENN